MSNVTNKETQRSEQLFAMPSKASVGEALPASLAFITMTAAQMQKFSNLCRDEKSGHYIGNDALLSSVLNQDKESRAEGNHGSDKIVAGGKMLSGENAVFEVAGLLTKLRGEAQKNMIQQMNERLNEEQGMLQNLIKQTEFMKTYQEALDQYEKDPTKKNFLNVVKILAEHFHNNPKIMKKLWKLEKDALAAEQSQKTWDNYTWAEKQVDRYLRNDKGEHAMSNFAAAAQKVFDSIIGVMLKNQPQLFDLYLQDGERAFKEAISRLIREISEMEIFIALLSGNPKELLFKIQSLIQRLEQEEINLNTTKSNNQTVIAGENIKDQQLLIKNANKAIGILASQNNSYHLGGIFGWVEDIVVSVYDLIKDGVTHQAVTVNDIPIAKDVKEIGQLVKNIVVAIVDLGETLAVLATNHTSNRDEIVNALLKSAGTNGMAILQNPKFQAIIQTIGDAVVITVAIISSILACVACNPELIPGILLVAGVLLTLNDVAGPAFNKLMSGATDDIAKWFGDTTGAKIAAAILVTIAVVIVTLIATVLTCGLLAPEAAAEGGEIAAEEGADEATNIVETILEQVIGGVQKTARGLKNTKVWAAGVGASMSTAGATALSTNLPKDIADLIHNKAWHLAIEVLLELSTIIFSIIGGVVCMGGAGEIASSVMDKYAAGLTKMIGKLMSATMVVQGGVGVGQGVNQVVQGSVKAELMKYKGEMGISDQIQQMTSQSIQQNNSNLKQMMKRFEQMLKATYEAPSMASQGVANVLEQLA